MLFYSKMAKIKNKKRVNADKVQKKKENLRNVKSINPFEVHLNREKFKVLGKKQKNDKGLPGISKAKAIKKRKRTLLQEYKLQNKSNKFVDKRIGEKNKDMTGADKTLVRFTAARIRANKKKNIFNLADDEIITHRGQTLSEIEKFDDPRSDDESLEDGQTGKLDSDFVKDVHFGGGIFSKTGHDGATSHKQLINQLIEESKKRKAEKQKIKETTLDLTEKLDTEWKDLMQIVNTKKSLGEDTADKHSLDDYDKMLRELKFEARGTVSDRLKNVKEVEKDEQEKLKTMEQDRIERMSEPFEAFKSKYRSADDLDDDVVYESDTEQMLTYNEEGKPSVIIEAKMNGKDVSEICDEADSDIELNSKSEYSNSESEDSLGDLKNAEAHSESDSEDDSNALAVLKAEENAAMSAIVNKPKSEDADFKYHRKHENKAEDIKEKLPKKISLPTSYENFVILLHRYSARQQSAVLEKLIKDNDPSLSQGNKEQLGLLFVFLLQYLNDLFSTVPDTQILTDHLFIYKSIMPQIYDLAQLNPLNAHKSILEVLKQKHEEFRIKKTSCPTLEVLFFFKLVSLLFTTSDFRHQVVTPCFVFMEQMLTKCRIKNGRDISRGFFLCTLVSEYTDLSNRYLPAAINFLTGILHMSIPKNGVQLIKVPPPFKPVYSQLVLLRDCSKIKPSSKLNPTILIDPEINDEFKINILYRTLQLLREFFEKYKTLPSCLEIFALVENFLKKIPLEYYPNEVINQHEQLGMSLNELRKNRRLNYVKLAEKKPKALRLYEPKIEEVYDTKRRKVQSKEKAERDKLIHKLKRERKGALREIRRDKAFLGRVKIKQKMHSDMERKEKVKRIFAEAAFQQSELNALDRKRKRV
ncbi:nucleolar protein 14 homolog [Cylas formicarius]|uniref:nucleolar protein 14 homolog n=1 Tax=Cylas formicarius TaxID=197179 RepID=UPI00295860E2|nr:nucleolar protein 14 homolog [Cylas formicarius]